MNKKWCILLMAFIVTCLSSCSDEEPIVIPVQEDVLAFHTGEVSLPTKGRYYTLGIFIPEGMTASELIVSTDSDWLELQADTVSTDGVIELFASANTEMKSREASVKVSTQNGGESATCLVRQKGLGDNDTNTSVADCFYIGWGYNIFNEYMSPNSVCAPIIDHEKVVGLTNNTSLVQSVLRSKEETEYITANTLYEMAELMTKQMTKTETNYKGSKKTVTRFETSGTVESGNESYAYLSLKRTVASSAIDVSMLLYQMDKGNTLFTEEFQKVYDQVCQSPTDEKLVGDVLEQFGTHLVVSSELGGIMDLAVNFSRTIKGELDMRADDFADYFFKSEPSDFTLPDGGIQGMNSKVSIGETFKILGGAESARQQIEKGIKSGSSNGSIDSNALKAWLESLECHSLDNTASLDNLMPVSFTLVPVWTLFPQTATGTFLKKMIEKSQQSNYSCQDYVTGTDYYAFPLNNASFMKFGEGEDQTLVRVVYASNNNGTLQPVLEVCNEYVPAIRGDKRITIIYGIKNGRTFHGAGLFPGDGEGNPPAFLTFSDGDVYVKPIKEKDAFEKVDTVYYLHGNIYETNLGIDTPVPSKQKIVDQQLTLVNKKYSIQESYPIVKIGSGYWTRQNINVPMYFGEPRDSSNPNSQYYLYERKNAETQNIYYACVFKGNDPQFVGWNKDVYGNEKDELFQIPIKWHVPQTSDANHLQKYLGNNLKALLIGQASGFGAQFMGNYSRWDDMNDGEDYGSYKIRYMNEYCFISFKNDENSSLALALSDDYQFHTIRRITQKSNLYPVRLFRTSYYTYK